MTKPTSFEEIDQLTRKFRESIIQPEGELSVKAEHIEYMSKTHFDIPNLDYDILSELPRFLFRTTIFPTGTKFGNADRSHFLMWMAEIRHYRWDFEYRDNLFPTLFDSLMRAHSVEVNKLPSSPDFRLTPLLMDVSMFAACFAFPLLERCIRTKCHEYVRGDGLVLQQFHIPRYGRRDRVYDVGNYISKISHELKLLELHVATSEFGKKLRSFIDEINEDFGLRFDDPYELIGYWRNRLLHGENIWSTGLDAVTYLICMMLMSEIRREEYNSKKDDLKKHIKFKQEKASPFLWYRYKLP